MAYLVRLFPVMINSLINHEDVKHFSDAGKINAVDFHCAQDFQMTFYPKRAFA